MMSADHPEKPGQSLSPTHLPEAYTQLQAEYEALQEAYGRLQEQSTSYRALFQQRRYGVIFLGLDTTVLDLNQRAAEMIGYSREDIIGRSSTDFIAPDESAQSQEIREQLLDGRSPASYQRTFLHKDGRRIVAEMDASLVRDVQGEPIFFQVFARDVTERNQAEDALQLSRKLVSTLSHLSTLPLELEVVLQAAADGLVEALGVPQCSISLADTDNQRLIIAADHPAPGSESYVGQYFGGKHYEQFLELLENREVIFIGDIHTFPLKPESWAILRQRDVCSLLLAPIVAQQDNVGLVSCATMDEPRHFSQAEIELVQTVTNLVGNRIEQAYLYEAERRQWAHSRTLQELGVVLTSSLDLDDVLDTIGNQILSLMDVSSCTIMLLEPPDELIWRTMIGLPEEIRRIGRQRVGEGLSGWVAAHRQTLQVEHAYNDARLRNASLRRRHGYYTFLGVPMEVKGELVGVFEIFTMEPRRFDQEEEALLAAFARQAAVAVENARLFEEVNKRVEELEQLYQTAHAMSASLDKEKVLLKLAEQLTQVMGVTSAYILETNEDLTRQTVVAEYWTDEANEKERISDMGVVYDLRNFKVIADAIKNGEVLNFHDDSDFVCESAREELQSYNVKSALVVPIIRSGRVYGEVELWESRRRREFTPQETKLAQTIAQHAASVIENARLFKQVQNHAALLEAEVAVRTAELEISNEQLTQEIEERKRIEEELLARSVSLSTINTIANTIYRTFDVQELVSEAVNGLMDYPKFMGVSIYRLNSADQTLHLMAHRGFGQDVVDTGRSISVDGSINGYAVRQKEIVISYDFGNDERVVPALAQMLYEEGVRGIAVIPIMVQDEVFGTYSIVLPENVTLTRQEQEMLMAISSSLGLAMANAQYVRQIEAEIKERQQVEEELKVYAAELEHSNRELQDFAYVASHDLQEPLRKIQAFGDRLQQTYSDRLDERGLDYLRRMESAATRMRTQIEDLLAFSRVTTAAQPFSWVDMSKIVAGVLSDLEIRIEEMAATVEVNPLPMIMADPAQMRHLMLNLMGNALKFHRSDTPPQVQIKSHYVQDYDELSDGRMVSRQMVQIVVQDNGIGFEEKYQERIFNLYERLHSRQEYEGTGMGLAICRKIVLRHNGRIQAKSQLGRGATFIVTLPVEQ